MRIANAISLFFSGLASIAAVVVALVALDVRFSPTGDQLIQALRSDLVDARAEKQELHVQVSSLREDIERMSGERDALTLELAPLQDEIANLREESKAQHDTLAALQSEQSSLLATNEQLSQQHSQYVRRIQALIVTEIAEKFAGKLKPYRDQLNLAQQYPKGLQYQELEWSYQKELSSLDTNTQKGIDRWQEINGHLSAASPDFILRAQLDKWVVPVGKYASLDGTDLTRVVLDDVKEELTISATENVPTALDEFRAVVDAGPLRPLQDEERAAFRETLLDFANGKRQTLSRSLMPLLYSPWTPEDVTVAVKEAKLAQDSALEFARMLAAKFWAD